MALGLATSATGGLSGRWRCAALPVLPTHIKPTISRRYAASLRASLTLPTMPMPGALCVALIALAEAQSVSLAAYGRLYFFSVCCDPGVMRWHMEWHAHAVLRTTRVCCARCCVLR
jgi:hypothetical protein